MLGAAYWMPAFLELGCLIGFKLDPSSNDDTHLPGSYHASHAEAQLICFFVRRNYYSETTMMAIQYRTIFFNYSCFKKGIGPPKLLLARRPVLLAQASQIIFRRHWV